MRRLLTATVALALVCAGTAEAKSMTLTGAVKGDSNSKVALKVDINPLHGTPDSVIKFTYAGITTYQAPEPGQIGDPCSIGEQSGKLPPAVPSIYPGSPGFLTFNAVDSNGGDPIQARGSLVYPKGKKGVGTMTFVQPDGTVCASKEFKLKKA